MLPRGLVPDTYGGSAWIGLTPFRLAGLRLWFGPALPWLSSFPETNLRTYVKGPAGDGVWFFSLDAARVLAVLGARWTFGLPYHWSRMKVEETGSRARYVSTRRGRATVEVTIEKGARLDNPDELALFLTERYRLYTTVLGQLSLVEVEHGRWPLYAAQVISLEETMRRAAGLPSDHAPPLVHFSPGVMVRVGGIQRALKERS